MARCWAFNKDGQRCEEEAGHSELHEIRFEWSDEECFSPILHQLPPALTPEVFASYPDIADLDSPVARCLVCDHAMHKGACSAPDGTEAGCTCRNGVSDR
jgi:hypothetical protein